MYSHGPWINNTAGEEAQVDWQWEPQDVSHRIMQHWGNWELRLLTWESHVRVSTMLTQLQHFLLSVVQRTRFNVPKYNSTSAAVINLITEFHYHLRTMTIIITGMVWVIRWMLRRQSLGVDEGWGNINDISNYPQALTWKYCLVILLFGSLMLLYLYTQFWTFRSGNNLLFSTLSTKERSQQLSDV